MNSSPVLDRKAYFAAAASWDHDRLAASRRSQRLAWSVAAGALVLATVACLAVAALAPLKSVEPFVVRVDRATGAVDVVSGLKGDVTPDEAVTKYFLSQYVRTREGWLPASAAEDFRQVAIMSTAEEQQRLGAWARATNPLSPQSLYGRDATVEVQVRSIAFINEAVANVRFRRTVRRMQAASTDDWIATVAFTYTRAPMRETDRLRNPLGFQVQTYRADPEVTP